MQRAQQASFHHGKPTRRGLARPAALAAAALLAPGTAALAQTLPDRPDFSEVSGLMMLDYSSMTLNNGGAFDLFGIHYLQRVNDWLHVGTGAFAPMAEGDYGGFFGADVTLHAQQNLYGNWFVNGGLAVGAAAGGASVTGIMTLSGEGLYGRAYAGVGYRFRHLNVGLNYSYATIVGSQVSDGTLNLFVQRPFSFTIADYDDAGSRLSADEFDAPEQENILSFQSNTARQVNPQGRYTGDIGLASLQFSHFLDRSIYGFFAVDIGYSGLLWYNQAHGGFGARMALADRWNLYGQIGIGSSGWVTNHVDTGPGFIIYPKVTLEYLWGNGLGATLSAGYFYAPMATSRNWTLGLGVNYHLSYAGGRQEGAPSGGDYTLRGVRMNVFGRVTSPITYNGRESDGISMVALQVDYALNDRWYLAGQVAAATTAFRGYAGYAEGFFGAGWQTRTYASGRLQGYAQLLYGLNDVGVDPAHEVGALLYPAVGFTYNLNDRLAIYGQAGAAISLGQYTGSHTNTFENYSVGLGMTYRFSLPTRS